VLTEVEDEMVAGDGTGESLLGILEDPAIGTAGSSGVRTVVPLLHPYRHPESAYRRSYDAGCAVKRDIPLGHSGTSGRARRVLEGKVPCPGNRAISLTSGNVDELMQFRGRPTDWVPGPFRLNQRYR
jgi:hypothetical protein